MADIDAINPVACANIEAVNGVTKADIQAVNGLGVCTSGATQWAMCFDDRDVSWAAAADIADVTEWEGNKYDASTGASDSTDLIDIAYGKDTEGNPIYVAIADSTGNNTWVDQTNDITDESAWTRKQLPSSTRRQRESIQWGNDVWVSVGRVETDQVDVHISTDGADTFSAIDITGLTNIVDGDLAGGDKGHIYALASDGAGKWMIGQGENLYFSSDDAATWAFLLQPEGTGNIIKDIVYTNSTWVVLYDDGADDAWAITCPADTAANMDATGDWGTAVQLIASTYKERDGTLVGNSSHLDGSLTKRMAAAGGKVVFLQCGNATNEMAKTQTATVDGKTITLDDLIVHVPLSDGKANAIATDGAGTWLVGGDGGDAGQNGGDICRSTNNGTTWTLIAEGISGTQAMIQGITPNVFLPL